MVSPQPRSEPQPDAFVIPPMGSWQVNPFVLRLSKDERTVVVERGFVVRGPVLSLSKEPHHERGVTLASLYPDAREELERW